MTLHEEKPHFLEFLNVIFKLSGIGLDIFYRPENAHTCLYVQMVIKIDICGLTLNFREGDLNNFQWQKARLVDFLQVV